MRSGIPTTWCPTLARMILLSLALGSLLSSGCAALTNPVMRGIPVRKVPQELLAQPKGELKTIPLTLLAQDKPESYLINVDDVLGIWIQGILGGDQYPAVQSSQAAFGQRRLPPSLGYPVAVNSNGKISLPMIDPVRVEGLTLPQAQEAIRNEYVNKQILKADRARVLVTLMQTRQTHVVVVRQENSGIGLSGGAGSSFSGGKTGTAFAVDLPAFENDVLHALAVSGGLPSFEACNEIIIERRLCKPGEGFGKLSFFKEGKDEFAAPKTTTGLARGDFAAGRQVENGFATCRADFPAELPAPRPMKEDSDCGRIIRIPLRMKPGEPVPFSAKDVILHDGDVVFVESRQEFFYTGGLIPPGQHGLPRDYDLDVVAAVMLTGGSVVSGGFSGSNLSGNQFSFGIGNPSPSLLTVIRKTPGGGQVPIRVDLNVAMVDVRERILVKPGDILILQETPAEALTRYFNNTFFSFNFAWFGSTPNTATIMNLSAPGSNTGGGGGIGN